MHRLRLALIAGAVAASAATPSASPLRDSRLPVFSPSQVQGTTRVTLLEVSRVTTFASEHLAPGADDKIRAIPGLKVVFRVENLAPSATKDLHEGGIKVLVGDDPLPTHPMVIPGGNSLVEPLKQQLRNGFQIDGMREGASQAALCYEYIRGLSVSVDRVHLEIRVGFDKLHVFRFKNVPLK
jgi:hypothetical protein